MSSETNAKTPQEIEIIRALGKIHAKMLKTLVDYSSPGRNTEEINDLCLDLCSKYNVHSSSLNYHNFPGALCTSINHVLCHGIPNKKDVLNAGDILTLDLAIYQHGLHVDGATTIIVDGKALNHLDATLVEHAKQCTSQGINAVKAHASLYDIANAITTYNYEFCKKNNVSFTICESFCGHFIGTKLHGDIVLHSLYNLSNKYIKYLKKRLVEGATLTIEPIIIQGQNPYADNVHKDYPLGEGKSAMFEHTVLITKKGCEIITQE